MRGQMESEFLCEFLCSGFLEWNGAFVLSRLMEQTGLSSVLYQNPEARRSEQEHERGQNWYGL